MVAFIWRNGPLQELFPRMETGDGAAPFSPWTACVHSQLYQPNPRPQNAPRPDWPVGGNADSASGGGFPGSRRPFSASGGRFLLGQLLQVGRREQDRLAAVQDGLLGDDAALHV